MRAKTPESPSYLGAVLPVFTVLLVACTSTPAAAPAGTAPVCPYDLAQALELASGAESACTACVRSGCNAQVEAYEGTAGCSGYLSCVCPLASSSSAGASTADAAAAGSCAVPLGEQGCASSAVALNACIDTTCATPCDRSSGGGSAGGIGSSGGTGIEDAGTVTLTGDCLTFATCCVNYYDALYEAELDAGLLLDAGSYESICAGEAEEFQSAGDTSECTSLIQSYADAGVLGCQ